MLTWVARRTGEATAAFGLFTRLPVGRHQTAPADFASCVWAYPLAGALVGVFGAGAYCIATASALPSGLAACAALIAQTLVSGGLHEDGLADTADGLGGGRTRDRKLEIMRDSRIGSFGAIALISSFAWRQTAITAIDTPWAVATALIAAGCLSRAALVGVLVAIPPARMDGMSAGLVGIDTRASAACGMIAIGVSFTLLTPGLAASSIGVACLAAGLTAWLARRQLGGHTGDILGANAVLAECLVLALVCATLPVARS